MEAWGRPDEASKHSRTEAAKVNRAGAGYLPSASAQVTEPGLGSWRCASRGRAPLRKYPRGFLWRARKPVRNLSRLPLCARDIVQVDTQPSVCGGRSHETGRELPMSSHSNVAANTRRGEGVARKSV